MKGAYNDIFLRLRRHIIAGILVCMLLPFYFALNTQESFFGHLKDEVDFSTAKTLNEVRTKIDHYMVYYNNYRYQWNLKKMAPVQYRNHLLAA